MAGRFFLHGILFWMLAGSLSQCAPDPRAADKDVRVEADRGWQDAGINIPGGMRLEVNVKSGSWAVNVDGEYANGDGYIGLVPDDIEGLCRAAPMPLEQNGALVGKIGKGEPFLIGNAKSFTAQDEGALFLRINDADACLGDNGGALVVHVRVAR